MQLDHQPHRLGRRWSRHAGHQAKIIARRLVASGIVITPMQIYNISKHHYFPPRGHTTAVIAQIGRLWGDGYSAGRIGGSLNLTRGQVMGVVHHRGFERTTHKRFTLNDLGDG